MFPRSCLIQSSTAELESQAKKGSGVSRHRVTQTLRASLNVRRIAGLRQTLDCVLFQLAPTTGPLVLS